MPVSYLSKVNKVVLCAGHGGSDPGAIGPLGQREADQTIFITDIVAKNLRERGVNVDVVPHSLDLQATINYINPRYKAYGNTNDNVWAIEIHRDMNAPNLPQEQKDNQIGIYYFDEDRNRVESPGDAGSLEIAKAMLDIYKKLGSYQGRTPNNLFDFDGSWAKDHFLEWAGFNLGFLEQTKPLTHLIEHGYMSGRNDQEHLTKLANWTSQAIYEVLTGKDYNQDQNKPLDMPVPQINQDELNQTREIINSTENINQNEHRHWLDTMNYVTPNRLLIESTKQVQQLEKDVENKNKDIKTLTDTNENLIKENQSLIKENEILKQTLAEKGNVQNPSTKPVWQSKKIAVLASLIPVLSGFLTFLPYPYNIYASSAYSLLALVYQYVQGGIDQKELERKSLELINQLKK